MKLSRAVLILVFLLAGALIHVDAQTTTISYQGALADGEFEFELFDAEPVGNSVAGSLTKSSVSVSDGSFSTELDRRVQW